MCTCEQASVSHPVQSACIAFLSVCEFLILQVLSADRTPMPVDVSHLSGAPPAQ